MKTDIILKPEEIWDYFSENKELLVDTMELIATNDEYDVSIYLTNEDGYPNLIIESSNFDSDEFVMCDEKECASTAQLVYELYLTEQIISVVAEADDYALRLNFEDAVAEREDDLSCFVRRFLEDVLGDDPLFYTDMIEDVVEDCKEHFLEYLYRKHQISTYRPMELEDDDGVFEEEYPYEYLIFDDCGKLYD